MAEKKRIKMKPGKSCAGPDYQYLEDREYTIDVEVADSLVNAGSADYVKVSVKPKVEEVKELVKEDPEQVVEVAEEPVKPKRGRVKKFKPEVESK